jgi:hypothetical protein
MNTDIGLMILPLGISVRVLRAFWLGFLPLGSWVCGFLLVILLGKAEKRRLGKILAWSLPIVLLPPAVALFLVVIVSNNPP